MKASYLLIALFLLGACGDGDALRSRGEPAASTRSPEPIPKPPTSVPPIEPLDGAVDVEVPDGTSDTPIDAADSADNEGLRIAAPSPSPPESDARMPIDAGMDAAPAVDPADAGAADGLTALSVVGDSAADTGPEGGTDDGAVLEASVDGATADATSQDNDAGDGGPYASLYNQVLAKLRECSAIGPGEYHHPAIVDEVGSCVGNCYLSQTCSDVRRYLCRQTGTALESCTIRCAGMTPSANFPCAPGSNETVPLAWTCDGLPDCTTGADERGCSPYACTNGEVITKSDARCDGFRDCLDASDESNCASLCPAGPS